MGSNPSSTQHLTNPNTVLWQLEAVPAALGRKILVKLYFSVSSFHTASVQHFLHVAGC